MREIKGVKVSKSLRREFLNNGFVHVPSVLSPALVESLRQRFEPLFDGQFTTGVFPDEWHWRQGISKEEAFREIVNSWKADDTLRSVVLSERLGEMACDLMNWDGARIAQDDLLWKPPGANGVGYHRDSSYISKQFSPYKNNSVTFWIALDDADETSGVVEYFKSSHENYVFKDVSQTFFNAAQLEKTKSKNVVALEVKAGDVLIHHQDILHGSAPNLSKTRPRRALGIHYIRSDVSWSNKYPVDYIYGRYRIAGENKPRNDFFPLVYERTKKSKL